MYILSGCVYALADGHLGLRYDHGVYKDAQRQFHAGLAGYF